MRSGVQNSDNNRENRINTSINNQKCSDKYKNVQTSTKMFLRPIVTPLSQDIFYQFSE